MTGAPYVAREVCELTSRGLHCVPIDQASPLVGLAGWVGVALLVAWVLWTGRK